MTYSASNKQLGFISTLITEINVLDQVAGSAFSITAKTSNFTTTSASAFIGELLAAKREIEQEARQEASAVIAEGENTRIDHGFHQLEIDGVVVILKVVRPKNVKGRPYAYGIKAQWDRSFWDDDESNGRWFYLGRKYNDLLSDATLLDATQAAAFGHANGWCLVCSINLEDPESVFDGIGPVCYKNITGETKAQARKAGNLRQLSAEVAKTIKERNAAKRANKAAEKRALCEV